MIPAFLTKLAFKSMYHYFRTEQCAGRVVAISQMNANSVNRHVIYNNSTTLQITKHIALQSVPIIIWLIQLLLELIKSISAFPSVLHHNLWR